MKTLEDIQNELSNNDYESDWNELSLVEQWSLSDEVAKRYALEYGQALLQKASEEENAESVIEDENGLIHIDVNSILNTKLDLI